MPWRAPIYPLPGIPEAGEPASFGAKRRHDIHTGVDLHCPEGTAVHAVEVGTIVAVCPFTGPSADSPWWLPTDAVMVLGPSGVVLYGEIVPADDVIPGVGVDVGDVLGYVARVLRHDKGKPTSMLHLELYEASVREPVWWRLDEERPSVLRDPTDFLRQVSRSVTV